MVSEPEKTIRAIIDRRLSLAGGECLIAVRIVAKTAIKKLGYVYNVYSRRTMCKTVVQVLQEYDINYWGHSNRQLTITDNKEIPLSVKIYQVRGKK